MFDITFSPPGPGRPISPKGPISPYLQKRGQTHPLNEVKPSADIFVQKGMKC